MTLMEISKLLACIVLIAADSIPNTDKPDSPKLEIISVPEIIETIDAGTKLDLFCNFNKAAKMWWTKDGKLIPKSAYDPETRIKLEFESISVSETANYICEALYENTPYKKSIYLRVIESPEANTVTSVCNVTINNAKPAGANAIYLEWTVKNCKSPLANLTIEYQKKLTTKWDPIPLTDTKIFSYVVNKLEKNTSYTFKISANDAAGPISPGYLKNGTSWITTLAEEPQFVPTIEITEQTDTSTSLAFSGKPDSLKDLVYYYNVTVSQSNSRTKTIRYQTAHKEKITIPREPGTTCNFRAAACNNYTKICGHWSEAVAKNNSPGLRPAGINLISVITVSLYFATKHVVV